MSVNWGTIKEETLMAIDNNTEAIQEQFAKTGEVTVNIKIKLATKNEATKAHMSLGFSKGSFKKSKIITMK
jgi:hypothetical protein